MYMPTNVKVLCLRMKSSMARTIWGVDSLWVIGVFSIK